MSAFRAYAAEASVDRPSRGRRASWRNGQHLAGDLGALGLVAVTAGLSWEHRLWLINGVELALLLWLPGVLLLRAIGLTARQTHENPAYTLGASLCVLISAALLANSLGPGLGVQRPLERLPLLCGLTGVNLILIAAARLRGAPDFLGYLPRPGRLRATTCLLALLPALAAVGALQLTNGDGATVAIVAAALSGLVLLVGAYRADRLRPEQCMAILYFASAALIFSFSLRGRFVYGSDILAEYHDFVGVLNAHRWAIHSHNPAYYSMMSLTTLPTLLSVLSGAAPLFVFKFVYPALLGIFPVGIFVIGKRFLSHRSAFTAAMLLAVQSYLFAEMPAIARQIIALVFLVALLAALSDPELPRPRARSLIVLFGLGLVVSHYGTTYFMVLMLGTALVLGGLLRLILRRTEILLADLCVGLVVLAVGAFVWYVPVTHSTANVSAVVTALRSQGLSLLPGSKSHKGLGSYISGNLPSAVSPMHLEHIVAAHYRKDDSFIHPLPEAKRPQWDLRPVPAPPAVVHDRRVVNALSLLDTIVTQLINLLAVLTSVWLACRRRTDPRLRTIALIGVGTLAGLAVIRVSGTVANQYNQERAFLQAFAPLSICIAWLLDACHRRSWPLKVVSILAPVGLIVTFFAASGLRARAFGGDVSANLSNAGAESDQFIVSTPEIVGAGWVDRTAGTSLLYTDRYGQLRVTAATGRVGGMFIDIMPRTLDRYAWIYADQRNVRSRIVSAEYNSFTSVYRWPAFVPKFWNQVYTNGYSSGYDRTG